VTQRTFAPLAGDARESPPFQGPSQEDKKQERVPVVASSRSPRLKKSVNFSDARRFWENAEYADVIRELATEQAGESRILLAKTYIRLQDYDGAVACLNKARFEAPRLQQMADIVSASAAERLDGGKPFSPSLPPNVSQHVSALREFYAALSAWRRGDLIQTEDLARRAASAGDLETRVYATDLLGWVANAKGDPNVACRHFLQVLDQLKAGGIRDEYLRINTIRALAFSAVEALDIGKIRRLEDELESISANDVTSRAYYGALLSIAQLHGLTGEDEEQYRMLLAARAVNVPRPFGALADTLLASMHRHRGEMNSARIHASFAAEALEGVDWTNSDVEERITAVLFAAEAAAQGDRRAGPAFTRAVSFRGKQDLALRFEHNQHATALGYVARARIHEMRAELDSAAEDYRRALAIWKKQGDRYRTALASLELLRVEGGTRIPSSLRDILREIPNSWLRREASRLTENAASPLAQLSPAERRVLEKICEGSTSRQIAEELDRSASTVRNQTISIFRKFGVSTRSALVAQVRANS
jgi:DNA-binding CsgD family transcriptional regulator